MFVIRAEQIETMGAARVESFLQEKLLRYLRNEYPEAIEGVAPEELSERCNRALAEARGYGMGWESSLFAFVALTFVLHPDFHRHPRIRDYLLDDSIVPDLRLQVAVEALDEEVWEAAAEDPVGRSEVVHA